MLACGNWKKKRIDIINKEKNNALANQKLRVLSMDIKAQMDMLQQVLNGMSLV